MTFLNPVVGGRTLIRPAIQSPNYVAGVSGWTINRDGTAEFADVDLRGSLTVGTPPSPPNPYIEGTVMGGIPTIAIYDGVHSNPARIQGFNLGSDGGMVLDSGDLAGEDTSLALAGDFGELFYEDVVGGGTALIHVGPPTFNIIQLRATGNGADDLEFGFDQQASTPDGGQGLLYTAGEIQMDWAAPDTNYVPRVVDGKVTSSQTVTTINSGTDTAIGGANAQNVYLEADWLYRVIISIDHRTGANGMRLDYKLWDGTVGSSTQLGGTQRKFVTNTGGSLFDNITLVFIWRQASTGTITNMNLSAARGAGASTADVATNQAYSLIVEKCGAASVVQGL